ncbi:MAG: SIS domain-containing protein, partial [Dysgonamonadaceae bacterium]|nr:SIS domain-containing protein [Dysgonamonadaceae bacterium]
MLALQWLENAYKTMEKIEKTQLDNIKAAALLMADSIEKKKWVHT